MAVRVEVETDTGRYWLTFPDHESVKLLDDERWSDYNCDCHPIWPGFIDLEGII